MTFEVFDAHAHLWKPAQGYDIKPLRDVPAFAAREWLPEDIFASMTSLGISQVVITQSAPQVCETRALLKHCRGLSQVAGVVGWADLATEAGLREAEELLDDPLILGLRLQLRRMPDDYISRPEVGRGLDLIEAKGKLAVFLSEARHHDGVLNALRRRPMLRAVLNHAGLPDLLNGDLRDWAASMRRYAADTQVLTQLSGLISLAGPGWTREGLRAPCELLLETFGPKRVMWASDWPMPIANGISYDRWREITEEMFDILGLLARERKLILRDVGVAAHSSNCA